jgi:hypothetical protein
MKLIPETRLRPRLRDSVWLRSDSQHSAPPMQGASVVHKTQCGHLHLFYILYALMLRVAKLEMHFPHMRL